MACSTPACPPLAKAYRIGRPISTAFAPRQSAYRSPEQIDCHLPLILQFTSNNMHAHTYTHTNTQDVSLPFCLIIFQPFLGASPSPSLCCNTQTRMPLGVRDVFVSVVTRSPIIYAATQTRTHTFCNHISRAWMVVTKVS